MPIICYDNASTVVRINKSGIKALKDAFINFLQHVILGANFYVFSLAA